MFFLKCKYFYNIFFQNAKNYWLLYTKIAYFCLQNN